MTRNDTCTKKLKKNLKTAHNDKGLFHYKNNDINCQQSK